MGKNIKIAAIIIVVSILIAPKLAQAITVFNNSLEIGDTGLDVKNLQILLNSDPDTQIADSGPGSPGRETGYFGPLTKAAVIRFQEKYAQDILAPLGLTRGTGFVGASTRDKLNALMSQSEDASAESVSNVSTEGISGQEGSIVSAIFDRNLSLGASGTIVKNLQILLNSDPDTQIADSGPGSPGRETGYFGPLTKAAVIRFQEKYAQDILAPLGLTRGTGFVGASTRDKLNALIGVLGLGRGPVSVEETNEVPDVDIEEKTEESKQAEQTGLTVSLSQSSSYDSGLVAGQSLGFLGEFTFTNNDNTEVKITKLELKRIGASANATLSRVYLFEGIKRIANPAGVSSLGTICFNEPTGILKIPANSSKTITVLADIATGTNSEIVGVSIEAADKIVSNASSVNGPFPIESDLTKIRSITLAEVDFNATTTPSADSDISLQNDFIIWQNTVNIPTRAVNLERFSLEKGGTIDNSDLKNFQLYINGVKVKSEESLDEDGFVIFDLSDSPKRLEIGYSTIMVTADISGGAGKDFSFSLRYAGDVSFLDAKYGVKVLATANGSAFSSRSSGTQTISSGSIKIVKKSGGPVDVVNGASALVIGEFNIIGADEKVKIESLEVEVLWVDDSGSTTVGNLRDGFILVDGIQFGSAADIDVDEDSSDGSGTTYTFGSSLIIEPGEVRTLTIKADIYDNDGSNSLANSDTLQVNILAGNSNAEGLASGSTISVPSADVLGQTVEVERGELDLSKYDYFGDKTYAAPIYNAKLAHFTLTSSKEDVMLTNLTVNLATVTGSVDASDDLSNLYIVYGDNFTSTKTAVKDGDNSWTISYMLEKHTVLKIAVYADVAYSAYSASTTDTITPKLTVTGTSIESGATATGGQTTGQTITFDVGKEGDLTGRVAGDSPLDRIVAGSTVQQVSDGNPRTITGAKFEFRAVNDDFVLKTVRLTLDEDDSGTAAASILYALAKDEDGSVIIDKNGNEAKREVGAGEDPDEIEFSGLEIPIAANTSKTLTFDLALAVPSSDVSPITSQANLQLELEKIKYENSLGDEISDSKPGPDNNDPDANNIYLYKSIPIFTHIDLDNTHSIYNGNSTKLYSFKVAADPAGDVALKQLKFGLSWNDNNTSDLYLKNWKFKRDGIDITDYVTIQNSSGSILETASATESDALVIVTFDTEEVIPAGQERIYDLYATPDNFDYSTTHLYDSVVINLKGGSDEAAHNGSNRYLVDDAGGVFQLAATAGGSGTDYNLIWSDISSIHHSYSADNDYPDWANGYLVRNLPLDGECWNGQ